MKQTIITTLSTGLLGATLALAGCSQPEAPPANTSPAMAPAAATPAPTVEVARSGDLQRATQELERALGEVQNRNYKGALDLFDSARKEVSAATNKPNVSAAIKTGLEQAGTALDQVRIVVDKRDPTAAKGLTDAITQISKLAERVQTLESQAEAAKAAAEKTAPKKQ